ncbi:MAG: flagellar biosynthesis protein FlhA [Bdellovibrionales bacterium]|nr:flagellar biosynthesis protein FlhA [Bdellovibrionales bacterium]
MDELFQFLKRFERVAKNVDLLVALGLVGILVVMMIPMPTWFMDISLSLSLAVSLLVLIVSIYTDRALDFSVFPSLLLMTTLFRLALNVASTRLILTEGHNGSEAAGQVIASFGNFVVGSNYVIGFIVFVILVVINFVVITKGSGRIAEVAARFTLDAMPGKQMSIDADLNAGLISESDARARRREIEREADFYGAMDGASKFVRGDAIAGIIITIVNVVGGLLVGIFQKDLSLATAAQHYTMLTIGDGLVTQIPALIISTAAGTVVTRSSTEKNMGAEIVGQLFLKPRAAAIVGAILGVLGLVPGLPGLPFFMLGGAMGGLAWVISRFDQEKVELKKRQDEEQALKPQKENVEKLLPLDLVELEVGYGLINIVESGESGDLLERIVSIRKQFALDLGIVVPSVHIRDNLQLEPGEYRVVMKGNRVGGGTLRADCYLAMDPGGVTEEMTGIPTREPAFGLDAIWISRGQKEQAEINGYTVVDLPTIMATHLTEILRTHAHELFGRQEADSLIENFKKIYPKVVDDLIPNILPLGTVVRVLQNLLREQVSIRDLRTIMETLGDEGAKTKDHEILTESVRKALSRTITNKYKNDDGSLPVMTLDASLEEMIANSLLQTEQGVQLVMDPRAAQTLITGVSSAIEHHPEIAGQPILLTSPTIRRHLYKLISRFIPQLIVLSHSEVSPDARVSAVGLVEMAHAS